MQINMSMNDWQHLQQMATMGELMTGIVHDLKNQLTCIGVNMSLIEAFNEQPAIQKYVDNINRQSAYATEMIEFILRTGDREFRHQPFDLAVLIEDVTTFFQHATDREITIKTHVDESEHITIGCQSLISNSILNLCSNARDAIGASASGVIEISLIRDHVEKIDNDLLNLNLSGDVLVLTVKDTGCGIESDQLDAIFKPYFSTKDTTKTNTGLGLANVFQTAKNHGIGMTVESAIGTGTTFKLYFKAAA